MLVFPTSSLPPKYKDGIQPHTVPASTGLEVLLKLDQLTRN